MSINYNPFNLLPYTIRFKLQAGWTPLVNVVNNVTYGTVTQVSIEDNIWDWTYEDSNWGPPGGTTGTNTYRSAFPSYATNGTISNQNLYVVLEEVLGANTTGVTNMNQLFSFSNSSPYSSLLSVPIFDMSSVTQAEGMFFGEAFMSTIPKYDTSNVVNAKDMFKGCHLLNNIELDLSACTNARAMFNDCFALDNIKLTNTNNISNGEYMFYNCYNLRTIPLDSTDSLSLATYMFNIFRSSSAPAKFRYKKCGLRELNYNLNFNNLTDASGMFAWQIYVETGITEIYNKLSSIAALAESSKHSNTFTGCGGYSTNGKSQLHDIPNGWKGV